MDRQRGIHPGPFLPKIETELGLAGSQWTIGDSPWKKRQRRKRRDMHLQVPFQYPRKTLRHIKDAASPSHYAESEYRGFRFIILYPQPKRLRSSNPRICVYGEQSLIAHRQRMARSMRGESFPASEPETPIRIFPPFNSEGNDIIALFDLDDDPHELDLPSAPGLRGFRCGFEISAWMASILPIRADTKPKRGSTSSDSGFPGMDLKFKEARWTEPWNRSAA